jgi:hypothetical protein
MVTINVNGMESKLELITDDFYKTAKNSLALPEREYTALSGQEERLHEGDPYTYLDLHGTIMDDMEFTFELTGKPENGDTSVLANQLLWLEIGIKPKAGLNFLELDWTDQDGDYIQSEALGTSYFSDGGYVSCYGPREYDIGS